MDTISNLYVSKEGGSPGFYEPHSAAIRIWHWTFFLVLTASMGTVLFASTLFKTRNTTGLVQEQLRQKGVVVNNEQARAVAHEFSDKLWNLHTILGYVLCGLLLSRIVIEIFQPGEEKLYVRIKKAIGFQPIDLLAKKEKSHYLRVKWTYLFFYVLIFTMALTGLGLAFENVPFFRTEHRIITQIHSVVQYFIYGFILLHLIGVITADLNKHKGLVSRMIHGKKWI
jgi:Ni/Fe-hydrogenase 1 B-type cytochrome subunit